MTMNSIKLKTHIGQDGLFQIELPIHNEDVEIMVIYQPISQQNHSIMKEKFAKLRQQFGDQVFSDSVELLREDRQRG